VAQWGVRRIFFESINNFGSRRLDALVETDQQDATRLREGASCQLKWESIWLERI
jgi:hypothetical protein